MSRSYRNERFSRIGHREKYGRPIKQIYRGSERAKSKRILKKQIEDPEGNHFYNENRWSLRWELEKCRIWTWPEYLEFWLEYETRMNHHLSREEVERKLYADWKVSNICK